MNTIPYLAKQSVLTSILVASLASQATTFWLTGNQSVITDNLSN